MQQFFTLQILTTGKYVCIFRIWYSMGGEFCAQDLILEYGLVIFIVIDMSNNEIGEAGTGGGA